MLDSAVAGPSRAETFRPRGAYLQNNIINSSPVTHSAGTNTMNNIKDRLLINLRLISYQFRLKDNGQTDWFLTRDVRTTDAR